MKLAALFPDTRAPSVPAQTVKRVVRNVLALCSQATNPRTLSATSIPGLLSLFQNVGRVNVGLTC